MKIRFLVTTASASPDFPFRAGQIIDVPHPTPEMLAWLKPLPDGTKRAEVFDAEPIEAAVTPEPERAVQPKAGKRRAGGWQREETRDAEASHGAHN